jgi:hypothetical protein
MKTWDAFVGTRATSRRAEGHGICCTSPQPAGRVRNNRLTFIAA